MNTQVKQGKKIGLNTLISWGASVVIIGLMFKLLHWPGGEWMIGLGLGVEACLFFLLGLNHINKDESVMPVAPQVTDHHRADELDRLLNTSVSPVTIERLNKGLERFNETVEAVNQVAGHATATQKMINEIEYTTLEMQEFRKNLVELNRKYKAQIEAFGK